jgi:hypothetical protein
VSLEADVGKPLLDVLREVVLDPAKQAAFGDDPSAYLAQYGYEDVPADDVSEAMSLVADTLPPEAAQAVAAATPVAPASPADDLGGDLETEAFGDVTPDFDAFAAGAGSPDPDDDLDADFGTGEVATVGDGYDDGAFGEGSDVGTGFPGGYDDTPLDPDDIVLDDGAVADELPGGYDDTPLDPDDIVLEDGGLADVPGDAPDVPEIPDDPGDFLDDIGSF